VRPLQSGSLKFQTDALPAAVLAIAFAEPPARAGPESSAPISFARLFE
jgi:hypothetical protein